MFFQNCIGQVNTRLSCLYISNWDGIWGGRSNFSKKIVRTQRRIKELQKFGFESAVNEKQHERQQMPGPSSDPIFL